MKKKLMAISLSLMLLLTAGCGKVPKLENGEEVVVSFASVRPVFKKDDAAFNKNVEMRMRECIRKQIAGKKVECKLAYTFVTKRDDKEIKEDHYDVSPLKSLSERKNIYPEGKDHCIGILQTNHKVSFTLSPKSSPNNLLDITRNFVPFLQ